MVHAEVEFAAAQRGTWVVCLTCRWKLERDNLVMGSWTEHLTSKDVSLTLASHTTGQGLFCSPLSLSLSLSLFLLPFGNLGRFE